ncbi:DUF4158 domain-containing protein, partial [Brucella sp. 09RB8913]|uniref:DUF4158 domain-containing protein n=1 Tax=Brucella sp. 09RB8913 TaxID=1844045 RepID=UPI0012AE0FEA
KCFQCLCYHTPINAIPKVIVDYIASYIDVEVDKTELQSYMRLKQRKRHKILICKFLKINNCKQQRKSIMKSAALKSSAIKENLADIINDILEELIKNSFEIPAFSTLLRLARASRLIVSTNLYQTISDQLTEETKQFFDQLLSSDEKFEEYSSGWAYLKQDLKKPTTNNIKAFTDYLEQLCIWRDQSPIDLSKIPEHRLDQYVAEAIALDISDMRRIKEIKRYTLSAMLLYQQ